MKTTGWLIGVVAGDGRISDRYVRVYNNDKTVIHKCKRFNNILAKKRCIR